jgi:thiol-disulfide isomerase/thioredoxin
MKKNILALSLVAILFAALGIFWGNKKVAPTAAQDSAVTHLLSQSMPDASGQSHALAQWKGKTLVVNFWATWCAPCVDEMPELSALQAEMAPRKIQILGIGIDSPSNIAQFASKYQISYPLYVSGINGTELSRQFGNQGGGLPYTVLISSDGTVKKTYLGRLKMKELRADLNEL